jgi:ATP-dependent protease ClpP protease subunit
MDITVNGTIVSNNDKWINDWCGFDSTCPKDVIKAMDDAAGDDITLLVNSGGGDLDAGNEIYSALKRYKGNTVAEITGCAASAATIICCGASKVKANPGIQYMIHNVSTWQHGDNRDMETMKNVLKTADISIANIYRLKTGLEEDRILKMMSTGTGNMGKWMDAKEAMELGFVDEIIGDNGSLARPISIYNAYGAVILSDEVKEKIRLEVARDNAPAFDSRKAQARLNLLKLKGGKVL